MNEIPFFPPRTGATLLGRLLSRTATLGVAGLVALSATTAGAADRTWDFGGNNNNWSGGANWSDDTIPGAGDTAIFADNLGNNPIWLSYSASVSNYDVGAITMTGGKFRTIQSHVNSGSLTIYGVGGTLLSNSGTSLLWFINGSDGTTFSLNLAGSGNIDISGGGGISIDVGINETGGSRSITKTGNGGGVLSIKGLSTYTGTTTVEGGSMWVTNDGTSSFGNLVNTSGLIINGGTFQLTGDSAITSRINDNAILTLNSNSHTVVSLMTNGLAETMSTVQVLSNSVIDMGTLDAGNALVFADSSSIAWSGELQIWNYSGSDLDKLFFGSDASGLTSDQLDSISFYSDGGNTLLGTATILSTGEVVVVPEPATFGLIGALAALSLILKRRRQ